MGMAGRNRGPVLRCQNALGRPRVVPQWDRRILDDADLIAALSQDLVDTSPASTVHKAAMHENNVLQACHLPLLPVSAFRAGGQGHESTRRVSHESQFRAVRSGAL